MVAAAIKTGRQDNATIIDYAHRGDAEGEIIRIQKTGSVFGNIKARAVWIAGRVVGDIDADEVYVGKNAKVRGTVRYNIIGIAPGGSITGVVHKVLVHSPVITEKLEPESVIERLPSDSGERRMRTLPGLIA